MKNILLSIFFLFAKLLHLQGQDTSAYLNVVEVFGKSDRYRFSEIADFEPDTLLSRVFAHHNLGEQLEIFTPLFVRNYGAGGGIIAASSRGTSSDHFQVFWNGIPLNSVTLGMADLSMFSVNTGSTYTLHTQAGAGVFGSGTFGGALDIISQPQGEENYALFNHLRLSHNYTQNNFSLGVSEGRKIHSQFSFYDRKGANDFKYKDIYKRGKPELKLMHNDINEKGFESNVNVYLEKNWKVQSGIRSVKKQRHIPLIMGSFGEGSQAQSDNLTLAYTSLQKSWKKETLEIRGGLSKSNMLFTDKERGGAYNIYSKTMQNTHLLMLNFRKGWKNNHIYFNGTYRKDEGRNTSYGTVAKDIYVINTLFHEWKNKAMSVKNGLTYRVDQKRDPKLLFESTLSFSHSVVGNLQWGFAQKYRRADFNERYWMPGGNENIKDEVGWTVTFDWTKQIKFNSHLEVSPHIQLYQSLINNWIQWLPIADLWQPVSYKKVSVKGLEPRIKAIWNKGSWTVLWNSMFQYTSSTNKQALNEKIEGKQLIYIPRQVWKNHIIISNQSYFAGVTHHYVGKRFTNAENTADQVMDGYDVINSFVGRKLIKKSIEIEGKILCYNIFNKTYESVKTYAQPLRYFGFSIQIKYKQKST